MKIYVIGQEATYIQMFIRNGWSYTENIEEADAIQFTGGSDVDPSFYGEIRHPSTYSNPARDAFEKNLYLSFPDKPKLGICRGSQLLTVLNGGSLWQDVDNHAVYGGHMAKNLLTDELVEVSSTHHQMMCPETSKNPYELLMTAGLSTRKSTGEDDFHCQPHEWNDVEAVYWPETNSLCYQPHPEFFDPNHECQKTYFDFINEKVVFQGKTDAP